MNTKTDLNHTVLASKVSPISENTIILCAILRPDNMVKEYVTWIITGLGYANGHYYPALQAAQKSFNTRI